MTTLRFSLFMLLFVALYAVVGLWANAMTLLGIWAGVLTYAYIRYGW